MARGLLAFSKTLRVRQNWEFKRAYRKGRRYHHPALTLVVGPNPPSTKGAPMEISQSETATRLGLSVSRKVGNAVLRNRLKRRLKEIFRQNRPLLAGGKDLVMVPKAAAARMESKDLKEAFLGLCKKAGLFAPGGKKP